MAINTKYFDNLIKRIEAAPSCSQELVTLMSEATGYLNPLLSKLQSEIEADAALIIPPTDLISVISWIKKLIQTYVIPYEKKLVEIGELSDKIAVVFGALGQKINDCSNIRGILTEAGTLGESELIDQATGLVTAAGADILLNLNLDPLDPGSANTLQSLLQISQSGIV